MPNEIYVIMYELVKTISITIHYYSTNIVNTLVVHNILYPISFYDLIMKIIII
jgi:hypothetical protein